VKGIRIYFEGDDKLRPGFNTFFKDIKETARQQRLDVKSVATNGTPSGDFAKALKSHPDWINLLLLDSEGPLEVISERQRQVASFDGANVFWMIELMESWFLADCDALEKYYGQGFNSNALPGNRQVQNISKKDVIDGLKRATEKTKPGRYHKTKHAPNLLALVDSDLVRTAASECQRLFDALERIINAASQ
jgi:hypothetical protein